MHSLLNQVGVTLRRRSLSVGLVIATTLAAMATLVGIDASTSASAATTSVFVDAPSAITGFESSMAFTPTPDPTLLTQLDNQQGSDADSTTYSQPIQVASNASINSISWWGTGSSQTGFMVALSDGVWPIVGSPLLPNGPVVNGTLVSLNVVPIAQVTQTAAANGQTKYTIAIPSASLNTTHSYRLSVTAVGGSFEWTTDRSGLKGGISWVRGRLQSYLTSWDSAFSLDFTTPTVPAAPKVVASPTPQTTSVGHGFSFTASASGSPAPTVQWQSSTNGGVNFTNVAGATTTTLTGTANSIEASQHLSFRAVFTNASGSASSRPATLTVIAPTSVILRASAARTVAGQLLTLTAEVTSLATGTAKVTVGHITFAAEGAKIASVPVIGGKAMWRQAFGAGARSLSATYVGVGAIQNALSNQIVINVAKVSTTTKVTAPKSASHSTLITVGVKVTNIAPGTGALSGSVRFFDYGKLFGTALVTTAGQATVTITLATVGSHVLTATYQGDANHSPSTAPPVGIKIS